MNAAGARAPLHPGLRRAARDRLRMHDRPGPPHTLLGARRHERAPRAHHGRRPARRRVLAPSWSTTATAAATRPTPSTTRCDHRKLLSWTETHSGMKVVDAIRGARARTAPRYASISATSPKPSWPPKHRPGSSRSLDRFAAHLERVERPGRLAPEPIRPRPSRRTATCHPTPPRCSTTTCRPTASPRNISPSPTCWRRPGRGVGRTVAVRGLAHEGGRRPRDDAGRAIPVPAFMAELEAAGGDFTRLSNTVAARDGALPTERLLADLRSEVLHSWQPPGGGADGALTHCVIHCLDIDRVRPAVTSRARRPHLRGSSRWWPTPRRPTCSAPTSPAWTLRADDLEWSSGDGCAGRRVPPRRSRWWPAAGCSQRVGFAARGRPASCGPEPAEPRGVRQHPGERPLLCRRVPRLLAEPSRARSLVLGPHGDVPADA